MKREDWRNLLLLLLLIVFGTGLMIATVAYGQAVKLNRPFWEMFQEELAAFP